MNTKHIFFAIVLTALLLAACQPAATPAPKVVVETEIVEREVVGETVIEVVAEPTEAPEREVVVTQEVEVVAEEPMYEPQEPLGQATPPAGSFFQDYGVNPFVDTFEDHLSTFAIDVDTASYSVARRYVNDGLVPPPDAVRVEEFVNYFEQDYPTPPDVAFGIYADGAPSPFNYDGTYILRFGIQGYEVPEWARKPASLTFVIDVSGSMDRDDRLGLVKRSLQMLVDRLRPDDTVAIVVYGSSARPVLSPTSGEDRATILDAIYSLRSEGSTNAEDGLRMGYQMAWNNFQPNAINRVILCSDGVANVGKTGPDEILETIRGYADLGITMTSVGFGMGNFNDVLMEQLANDGDGHYAYVDTLDEAEKLFVEDMTSTLQVIALDAKVQVDFNQDVVDRYRLIGYENRDVADQDFRNDAVDAGEIGAGHSVTALYAVQFRPEAEGRIATIQLRWKDPDTREVVEINGNFNTWDLAANFVETSPRYQLSVVVCQYAEVLRRSPWAGGTSMSLLADHAYRLVDLIPDDMEVREFAQLVERADRIAVFP